MEEIEIDLRVDGKTILEYYTNVLPRIGEKIELEIEGENGLFLVEDIIHKIFEIKKHGSSLYEATEKVNYVRILAKRI